MVGGNSCSTVKLICVYFGVYKFLFSTSTVLFASDDSDRRQAHKARVNERIVDSSRPFLLLSCSSLSVIQNGNFRTDWGNQKLVPSQYRFNNSRRFRRRFPRTAAAAAEFLIPENLRKIFTEIAAAARRLPAGRKRSDATV